MTNYKLNTRQSFMLLRLVKKHLDAGELVDLFSKAKEGEEGGVKTGLLIIDTFLDLMDKAEDDLYVFLADVMKKEVEEVEELPLHETLEAIESLVSDEDLMKSLGKLFPLESTES